MKNKKIPKFAHRLPVLVLALIIAVIPITMAAPVHASVLDGGFTYYVDYSGYRVLVPDSTSSYVFCINYNGSVFTALLYTSQYPMYARFSSESHMLSTGIDTSYGPYNLSKAILELGSTVPSVIDFSDAEFESIYITGDLIMGAAVGAAVGDVSVEGMPLLSVVSAPNVGVLDTFSGVGTWLSGAAQNISTMFWTAESGMTVLGYLAVASLALAVILLVFYLIAGWLKFH